MLPFLEEKLLHILITYFSLLKIYYIMGHNLGKTDIF